MLPVALLTALAFVPHPLHDLGSERVNGFALAPDAFVTWGDRVLWRDAPGAPARELRGRGPLLGEPGCLMDADGDGRLDAVVSEPDALVWYRNPGGARCVIDAGAVPADVIPATLFGRPGVLVIHKHQQVRFYEAPPEPSAPWQLRDLYSVYTPSRQGGLALADIDRDGRPDILCGNYWIRAPERPDLPWRLFAINTWTEQERSGMLRLAWLGGALAMAQRAMAPARLALFEPPADPRRLWRAHPLAGLPLDTVNSLEAADFDGDNRPDLLAAENASQGRVVVFRNRRGTPVPEVIARGAPVRRAAAADIDRDGDPDILLLGRDALWWLENRTR